MKYFVWGTMPLGSGYLHFENGKRIWGSYFCAQYFTAEEIDSVLAKIGQEWSWRCYDTAHNLYKQHNAHYVYV